MIPLLLALALSASSNDRTIYLVRPLYPGQELLAQRTETAIGQLFQKDAREKQVIGRTELARFLAGRSIDLSCALGDAACADPIDAAMRALAVDWILLIKGGQEESAYRFVVTAYNPNTGETQRAESAEPSLEMAILGALVKVVPLASTVHIDCEQGKATVTIDSEKVGETPYTGQVLPGEHVIRLEAPGYVPFSETIHVPARGQLNLKRAMAGTPGKLVVHALPAQAEISVDGTVVGKGSYEKPASPGTHKLFVALEGYHTYEALITVKAGEQYTADVNLQATTGLIVSQSLKEQGENIQKRTSHVNLLFEHATFGSFLPVNGLTNNKTSGDLYGVSAEYAYAGRFVGVILANPALLFTTSGGAHTSDPGGHANLTGLEIRALQPFLRIVVWRFALHIQVGAEARYFSASGIENTALKGSQWDLQVAAQIGLRGFLWEGLFLDAALRQTIPMVTLANGATDTLNVGRSAWWGFNVGVGYAF